MPSNDPTDTGGLFIGRRPGTAPLQFRGQPATAGRRRQRLDSMLAGGILVLETAVCLTVWGPQPAAWLWVGSQVDYRTESVSFGIITAFLGMIVTLLLTLMLAKRIDLWWRLVRRAAGHEQRTGMLERIFVISIAIAGSAFVFWFFVIVGPGPTIAPTG